MATLKLDTRRARKDGTYPIVITLGLGTNIVLPTYVYARADEWDGKHYTGTGARSVNALLDTQLTRVKARIIELRQSGLLCSLSRSDLRAMVADPDMVEPPKPKEPSLLDVFNQTISLKSRRTAQIYASTLTVLRRYCDPEKVHFGDINKVWLDGWCSLMGDLNANTRSIHLRNLRSVINDAIDMGITNNYPFRRYKIPSAPVRKKAFDVDTLRCIIHADLEPWQQRHRDVFVLIFMLCGINIVDLCNLDKIRNGRIEYDRAKTHKHYSIKVEPEALEIINRLRGESHLLYMLDNCKTYRIYYNTLVQGLKSIRDLLGLDELTTYWARHSWATIAASLDIPKETIAAALGHGGNSVTDIYIDFDRRKVDEANRRVLDWVLYGKK